LVKESKDTAPKNLSVSKNLAKYLTNLSSRWSRRRNRKIKKINLYRPKSELESRRERIKKYLEKNPPATINEAVYRREELTGIKRIPTQVSKFLKSMLIKCLKVGSLPSKADRDEQEDYKEKKLEPRLNEAKEARFCLVFWETFR
jgi:hypothetical protein